MAKLLKKVMKAAKKIEKVTKAPIKKVLPPKVYRAASKIVRNPVFQTVAMTVATAGAGAVIKGGLKAASKQVLKKAAVSGVKKAAGRAAISGVQKKIIQNKVKSAQQRIDQNSGNYEEAAQVINETAAAALPIAAAQAAQGNQNVAENWVNSDVYKAGTVVATDAATRGQIIENLRAEGVPENQINQAADAVVTTLAEKSVERTQEKVAGNGSKLALLAIPLLLALMGG